MLTDSEIMACVQRGESSLFAVLAERYRPKLVRFARSRVRDESWVEDLVQDALLAAFQHRMSYRPEFAFSTWLWTIVINCSRQWQRKISRRQELQDKYAQSITRQHDSKVGITALLREEEEGQLAEWLEELSPAEADAIRLRFFGELSFEEVAQTMNSSVSGAKARVRKGLTKLAEIARRNDQ
ncbi:MAG: RNA polymerase sigma factor [Planctomycetaceae bacterium]